VSFKTFNEYVNQYSKDFNSYTGKVGIASNESSNFQHFKHLKSHFDLNENTSEIPVIMFEGFAFESESINESFTYNANNCPDLEAVRSDFSKSDFITNEVTVLSEVKKLRFPVTAYYGDDHKDFKTIGQLKKSEHVYDKFREKIVPKTRFRTLSFKGEPISIVEYVNKLPLDVNLKRFKHLNQVSNISKSLYEKYKLDFYNIEILESINGVLYVNGVNKKLDLNPHQSFKVYEAAFEDFYSTCIPNWVKRKMIKEDVSKYYQTKLYDTMLIKTENTMDYSKMLNI
jgi:hypothetical protein